MDLTTLAIFRAVAEELSITRTAARLDRAPSNVTTRIQQLEEELGVALFKRDRKRLALTAEGALFSDYAGRILNLAGEARQMLAPGTPSGVLRVGAMECTVASRLPPALAAFSRRWPEVTLDLSTAPSRQLLADVRENRLDCAFVALPEDETTDGLEHETAFTEELLLILPPSHPPAATAGAVGPKRLAAFAPGCTYRALAEDWLAGAERPFAVHTVRSYHAMIAYVSAGGCVGVLPKSVLDLNRAMAPVTERPLRTVETVLVRRRGGETPALRMFRETLAGLGA